MREGVVRSAAPSAQMEGVGSGALEAARKYKESDFRALIKWPEGKPVPYSLLAETFEARGGASGKRHVTARGCNLERKRESPDGAG
jgi:hypothetical protein